MDVQIILLWIGLSITFALGLINFLWGPAILTRREKVAIVNPEVYTFFVPKDMRQKASEGIIALQYECDAVQVEVSCELVLIQGEGKLEVKAVELMLDEQVLKGLENYLHPPDPDSLRLNQITDNEAEEILVTPILLSTKQSLRFHGGLYLDCTDGFEKARDKIGLDSYPKFIQGILDKVRSEYQICWTRYDGKRICWRFPDRWWRNLGKKIWG
jgi:hypothetical protein